MKIFKKEEIAKVLIEESNKIFKEKRSPLLSLNLKVNEFLTDLKKYPHAFVFFCLSQRASRVGKSTEVAYKIYKEIGGFEFKNLLSLKLEDLLDIFNRLKLHRFPNKMGENYYKVIQKIHNEYEDNAALIWNNNPSSAAVVRRFLEFEGISQKIATMAANILVREFKIPKSDYYSIDVSVDTHVRRVFMRTGLVKNNASDEEIIYTARELNPEYPGIFDLPCWDIGRNYCKPKNPSCGICSLKNLCPRNIS